MSFDVDPRCEDPHAECAHEIHRLEAEMRSVAEATGTLIVCREGGGPESVAGTLALSVAKLREQHEAAVGIINSRGLVIDQLRAELDAARAILAPLDRLREPEGASVTFHHDNPDHNGLPNCCVTVSDDWTGWEDRDFRADTLAECLATAERAKADGKGVGT